MAIKLQRQIRRLLPRRPRDYHIWAGPLKGRRLVTSWHDYPGALLGYTERSLVAWLNSNVEQDQTWVDVGAHYGYTALALCQCVGSMGRVYAFEPVLRTAGCLSRTRQLNSLSQLTIVPLALGSTAAVRAVEVAAVRGMADHLGGAKATSIETILSVSFDAVWPGICAEQARVHGIKIDVQGMEIDVLAGMRGTLMSSRPVLVVEIHSGVDRGVLLELLHSMGYSHAGKSVEAAEGDGEARYLDNRSYCFYPVDA